MHKQRIGYILLIASAVITFQHFQYCVHLRMTHIVSLSVAEQLIISSTLFHKLSHTILEYNCLSAKVDKSSVPSIQQTFFSIHRWSWRFVCSSSSCAVMQLAAIDVQYHTKYIHSEADSQICLRIHAFARSNIDKGPCFFRQYHWFRGNIYLTWINQNIQCECELYMSKIGRARRIRRKLPYAFAQKLNEWE